MLICALIVFFPIAVSTMVGIRSVDARLLELARSLRATRWQVLREFQIPAALPQILGGLRVGVTLAVVGAIVAEWAGADRGLGVLINLARGSLFDTPLLFAALSHDRPDRGVPVSRRRARRAPSRRAVGVVDLDVSQSVRSPRHRAVVLRLSSPSSPSSSRRAGRRVGQPSPPAPTALKVGLGYIPSVQFAPFYYAHPQGYYRDAGLDVTFQNRNDPELITLVGQGALDIGIGDGTSVIPAASQGIPVRYVATIYAKFPNVVFAKASSGIKTAADLKGRKLGTPGKYGSSWIMLQALLASAGLTPDDLTITLYPDYGQATVPCRRGRSTRRRASPTTSRCS